MKKLFLAVFISFLSLVFAVDVTEDIRIKNAPRTNDLVKGTVVHIFEDFVNNSTTIQKIAKVRLANTPASKELTLIELNNDTITLNQGDQILISKVDNNDTFGMGDSFDSRFTFFDFARDNGVFIIIFGTFLAALLLLNKESLKLASLVGANIVLFFVILPVFLRFKISELFFLPLFFAANGYLAFFHFSSKKYKLALQTTIAGVISTSILYGLFISLTKLNEYIFIKKVLPLPSLDTLVSVDILSFSCIGFFIYLYTTILFIKISYTQNIYENFRIFFFKLFTLYFFLGVGMLLPTLAFFNYNDLGIFYLFNFVPFVVLCTKFIFLFWGNVISCLLYLCYFYIQNKQHFQKHLVMPGDYQPKKTIDLDHILDTQRVSKYNTKSFKKRIVHRITNKKIEIRAAKDNAKKSRPAIKRKK